MARKTRKQTIGHPQVQTDIKSGGKVIAARPVHMNTTPPSIDRQRLANLKNTAEGIGAVALSVERQRQIYAKKYAEKEAILGAADAKLATARTLEGHQEYVSTAKTGARIQGYMGQVGTQAAYEAQREHDQYMRENPALTEDQFNESIGGVVAAKLKGMNDKFFVKSFLVGMGKYEAQARSLWEQDSYIRGQEETATAYNAVARDDLMAMPEGSPSSDVLARLNQYETDMRGQGFHADDIFTSKLQMAEEHAIRTGDVTIFGTDNLGIWEEDVVGADGKKRPGSANSTKRNVDITDARNRVNRKIVGDTAKKDKNADLAYRRQAARLEKEESPEALEALANARWETGYMTAAEKHAAEQKVMEMREGIHHRQGVELAIDGFVKYPEGTTTKDIQAGIDKSAREVERLAQDHPDEYVVAVELHRDREASTGVMDSDFVRRIKGNRPSLHGNPTAFHRDSFIIAERAENSPALLRNNLGNDEVNQHLLYVDLIESGYNSHTAFGMLVEWNSKEGRDRAAAFTREKDYYDDVDEYLEDRADDGLDNSGYAKNQLRSRIKVNFMSNGGNINLAYEQAERDVESQFSTVTLPGTDDGDGNEIELFVDTGGIKLPDPETLGATMKAVTQDPVFRKKHGVPDDAVLYWGPNPNDRQGPWRIYDSSNNRPVTYSTGGQVKFAEVNVRAATSEYSAEQARLKREARTAKALEDAKANKASRGRHQGNLDKAEAQRKQAEAQRTPFAKHLTDLFD